PLAATQRLQLGGSCVADVFTQHVLRPYLSLTLRIRAVRIDKDEAAHVAHMNPRQAATAVVIADNPASAFNVALKQHDVAAPNGSHAGGGRRARKYLGPAPRAVQALVVKPQIPR